MLRACYENVASMLRAHSEHVASMLRAFCEHVANMFNSFTDELKELNCFVDVLQTLAGTAIQLYIKKLAQHRQGATNTAKPMVWGHWQTLLMCREDRM